MRLSGKLLGVEGACFQDLPLEPLLGTEARLNSFMTFFGELMNWIS